MEALARSPSEKQPDLLLPVADIVGGRPLGALSTWSAMGSSSAQAILQWIIELCFTRSATMEVSPYYELYICYDWLNVASSCPLLRWPPNICCSLHYSALVYQTCKRQRPASDETMTNLLSADTFQ